MGLHLSEGWASVSTSPLFGITLTLVAYQVSRRLWEMTGRHSVANPVLISIVLIGGVLMLGDVDYSDYMTGGQYIAFLLGPATVALAIPLHRELALVKEAMVPVVVGLSVGSVVAIVAGYAVTRLLGGDEALALSMAPKSATTPVSIALSESVGGIPSLTAVLTILAGVLGAVAGPMVLTLFRFHDRRVRGLAIGMSSHGIGTSRAFHEHPVVGAFSGMAMALNALATAVALPLLLLVLQ